MLAAQANAENFLEVPAAARDRTIDQSISERPGTQIGRYKLLQQIGVGGFGVMFLSGFRDVLGSRDDLDEG